MCDEGNSVKDDMNYGIEIYSDHISNPLNDNLKERGASLECISSLGSRNSRNPSTSSLRSKSPSISSVISSISGRHSRVKKNALGKSILSTLNKRNNRKTPKYLSAGANSKNKHNSSNPQNGSNNQPPRPHVKGTLVQDLSDVIKRYSSQSPHRRGTHDGQGKHVPKLYEVLKTRVWESKLELYISKYLSKINAIKDRNKWLSAQIRQNSRKLQGGYGSQFNYVDGGHDPDITIEQQKINLIKELKKEWNLLNYTVDRLRGEAKTVQSQMNHAEEVVAALKKADSVKEWSNDNIPIVIELHKKIAKKFEIVSGLRAFNEIQNNMCQENEDHELTQQNELINMKEEIKNLRDKISDDKILNEIKKRATLNRRKTPLSHLNLSLKTQERVPQKKVPFAARLSNATREQAVSDVTIEDKEIRTQVHIKPKIENTSSMNRRASDHPTAMPVFDQLSHKNSSNKMASTLTSKASTHSSVGKEILMACEQGEKAGEHQSDLALGEGVSISATSDVPEETPIRRNSNGDIRSHSSKSSRCGTQSPIYNVEENELKDIFTIKDEEVEEKTKDEEVEEQTRDEEVEEKTKDEEVEEKTKDEEVEEQMRDEEVEEKTRDEEEKKDITQEVNDNKLLETVESAEKTTEPDWMNESF